MQDIIKKYKKHKLVSNSIIVLSSLILAFWANYLFFETNFWENIKANLLENSKKEDLWDVYLVEDKSIVSIKTNKDISDIKDLSVSIVFNWENISIENLKSDIENTNLDNISNTPWIINVFLNFGENKNLKRWDELLEFRTIKKNDKTESINIINANFTDNLWENYLLNTSWITF